MKYQEKRVMKVYDPIRLQWFIGKVWVENGKVYVERCENII